MVELDKSISVTVTTEIAANIYAGNFTIRQEKEDFSEYKEYTLAIIPTNPIPRLGWIEVELPALVGVIPEEMLTDQYVGVTKGANEFNYETAYQKAFEGFCKIETTRIFTENCNLRVVKRDGAIKRFVTFYNAFLFAEQYSSEFTIQMTLRNPDDNFPRDN